MGNEMSTKSKTRKWAQLGGKKLVYLLDQTENKLVPIVEAAGYERINHYFGVPDHKVSASRMHFQRAANTGFDAITFAFDKYHRPKFQVELTRAQLGLDFEWDQKANLLKRNCHWFHFFGKPFWFPARFWTDRMADRAVDQVRVRLPSALQFLDTGERGQAVSKAIG